MARTRRTQQTSPKAEEWVRPALQERSRDQRDRLLKAGEHVFAREGFWGAHVTQIAEEAGCSVGSFYRRFKDKEALFFALQTDMAEHAKRNIDAAFDDPNWLTSPLPEMFEQLMRNTARTIVRIQGYYRALYEMSLRGHKVWDPMRALERHQGERIAGMLEARGISIKHDDVVTAAQLAVRMINGLLISSVIHQAAPYRSDDPKLHREMALILTRYLGIEPTRTRKERPKDD